MIQKEIFEFLAFRAFGDNEMLRESVFRPLKKCRGLKRSDRPIGLFFVTENRAEATVAWGSK
jgi:hypothetical protein